MASVHLGLIALIFITCYSDAAQIVSPASDTLTVTEGSDVQLICHSSSNDSPIVWSYNGMPVDAQSPSVEVSSQESEHEGETVVVNTLVLHNVPAAYNRRTYTCKPEDDVLNLDADEVELIIVTSTTSQLRLVEAESSSTLTLDEDEEANLSLHCVAEYQSQPVWYHNDQQLEEDTRTSITVRVDVANYIKESFLTILGGMVGQFQCRDASGHQRDSDVLNVVRG